MLKLANGAELFEYLVASGKYNSFYTPDTLKREQMTL
jgi:hypothetical protein